MRKDDDSKIHCIYDVYRLTLALNEERIKNEDKVKEAVEKAGETHEELLKKAMAEAEDTYREKLEQALKEEKDAASAAIEKAWEEERKKSQEQLEELKVYDGEKEGGGGGEIERSGK